jgi:hypothetical protein
MNPQTQTPEDAHRDAMQAVRHQVSLLQTWLNNATIEGEYGFHDINWAHVGDVNNVKQQLIQITESLDLH